MAGGRHPRKPTNEPSIASSCLTHVFNTTHKKGTQSGGNSGKKKKKSVPAILLSDNPGPTPNKDITCTRAHGNTSHLRPAFFNENCTAKYGM